MFHKKKQFFVFILAVFVHFSTSPVFAGVMQEKPLPEQWAEDVDYLVRELPQRHINLFFKISDHEFRAMAAEFKQRLPELNQDEFQVGLSRLVAAAGDSHTGLRPQITRAFPLMLYWFEDGIYVLNTVPEYEEILYGRITRVQDHPVDEVIEAFSEILPHENRAQLKSSIPQILASAQHLHGLNIIPDTETMRLTVENGKGHTVAADMTSLPLGGMFKGIVDMRDDSGWPLYRQNRGRFYWYEYLPDKKIMYFKYNACREHTADPFIEFSQRLLAEIDAAAVEKLVIDVRHNGGGNSGILDPFIDTLAQHETLNQKGRLFVIIGRQTFSSAILNVIDLRKKTEAILVGEPTGGKPNHYGELKFLTLPNTKMVVSYSTKYFTHAEKDTPSLMPDISVKMTFQDYRTGRDPFLEAVLEQ
jgi:hypothetical protein